MADETNNPATQVSSGISSFIGGVWAALAQSENSWRGLIGLTLILVFILVYQGKLTPQQIPVPVKADNSECLSSVANIGKDIADLKAYTASSVGELSEKMETLKVVPVAPVVKPQRAKKIQAAIDPPRP